MSQSEPRRALRLADLGVNVRILLAIGVAAAVALGVGVLGLVAIGHTSAAANGLYAHNFVGFEHAATMRRAVFEMRLSVTGQAIALPDETQAFEARVDEAEAAARDALADYRTADLTARQVELLETFEASLEEYLTIKDDVLVPAGRVQDLDAWRDGRDAAAAPIGTMMDALAELVEIEKADGAAAAQSAQEVASANRTQVLALLAVGLTLALVTGVLVARSIVRALEKVRAVSEALERGDLTVSAGLTARDEVGRMGQALDNAVETLRGLVGTIDASAGSLAGAAEQMSGTTQSIAAGAEETAAQAGVVSVAAEQVSRNVQTVASGSEQMGASIREIAHNAAEAARVAASAVDAARSSAASVNRLGDSSKEIGNVVKAITAIAEQTNLLALNATIEAARAGEAGKGFAVVAGEVKELAQETARATEDIARRVEAIQADSAGAVTAIGTISEIIDAINGFQSTIASAVEEQTATTHEMNRNVTEAATGSGEIAANFAGVASAADQTTRGVGESQEAVAELARMSAELRVLVGRFTV